MEVANLEQMLDRIEAAADGRERVDLDVVVEAVGRRSFGPLLLLAGVTIASPLSGIPGLPTVMGALVLLIAVQLLLRRGCCWLPRWMLRRSIARPKLVKGLAWVRPVARRVDRWLRPRVPQLVGPTGAVVIAAACAVIAAGMPVMEFVPFSSSIAGVALAAFGLALIAHDGALALLAFVATGSVFALAASRLL